jgi:UTP-glucose-1-phosphate uridylyltransferase
MDNGTDGFTIRAALDILLDDVLATESGIQRVVLVVSPSQIDSVLSFFRSTGLANMKGSNTIPSSVSDAVIQGEETLDILPDRVTMVVQQTPQGFGDAILCARSLLLKDKRFFVILGDHLFSCGNESGTECFKWLQRVSSTMNEENCITAVGTCTYDETSANGLIAPFHREEMTNEIWNCFPIKQMLEKPPVGTSIETLLPYTLPNRNDHREFLCHFGIDILPTERILQILSTLAQKRKSASTEICLRQAMMSMLVDDRAVLYGSLMSPPFRRHDLGNPRAYWKTLSSFANDV